MIRLLVASVATVLAGAAQACQMPAWNNARTLNDKDFTVAWRLVPPQPKVGEFFVVEFAACDRADASQPPRIDAIMPAHKHGMNFQPKTTTTGPGLYRAEGLMFHMPGTWQLIFEQRTANGAARVTAEIEIE